MAFQLSELQVAILGALRAMQFEDTPLLDADGKATTNPAQNCRFREGVPESFVEAWLTPVGDHRAASRGRAAFKKAIDELIVRKALELGDGKLCRSYPKTGHLWSWYNAAC